MTTTLWIIQGVLAAIFVMAGSMKLMTSKADLVAKGMKPLENLSESQIKMIGGLEVAGGVGVILPVALGILPILTGFAAVGLVLTMLGAAFTHAQLGEYPAIGFNLVLAGLASYVAVAHF